VNAAIAALNRGAAHAPANGQIASLLSQAYLQRGEESDADAAVAALQRAIDAGNASVELQHNLGAALLRAGNPEPAIVVLKKVIELRPDYASAHFHLAAAHRSLGQQSAARTQLLKALELEPGSAKGWHALATLDAEAGNLEIAAGLYRRAIRADATLAAAHRGLADVLARQGRGRESVATFSRAQSLAMDAMGAKATRHLDRSQSVAEMEKRITPDQFGAQLHQALAGLMNLPPPLQIAGEEVTSLFDRYADRFDAHLKEKLNYRAPEMLAQTIAPYLPERPLNVLDLGCGTGLCGPLLRPYAARLAGVDLSPAMIEKARERNIYDDLQVGDLVDAMQKLPQPADLLVAADVLIYIGDLAPTFEAAAKSLRAGGIFAFSVEANEGERFHLVHRTRRYTHAKSYLERLAQIYGFEEKHLGPVTLRTDALQPVQGLIMVLRQPG
jgi:predicted TPR repeat methyltransferase